MLFPNLYHTVQQLCLFTDVARQRFYLPVSKRPDSTWWLCLGAYFVVFVQARTRCTSRCVVIQRNRNKAPPHLVNNYHTVILKNSSGISGAATMCWSVKFSLDAKLQRAQIFSTVVLLGTEGIFVNNIKTVGKFLDDAQRLGWLVTVCSWIQYKAVANKEVRNTECVVTVLFYQSLYCPLFYCCLFYVVSS